LAILPSHKPTGDGTFTVTSCIAQPRAFFSVTSE
jgi:hypothetical protein